MRTRTVWKFAANPFVVMTDITIALAFVMFGYYLANAEAYKHQLKMAMRRGEIERDKRQVRVAYEIAEAVRNELPGGAEVRGYIWPADVEKQRRLGERDADSLVCQVLLDGASFLEVHRNETFMRLKFLGVPFRRGAAQFAHSLAPEIYEAAAEPMRDLLPGIAYLFVHGLASRDEATSESGRIELSQRRANAVFGMLQDIGLIADRDSGISEEDLQEAKKYRGQRQTFTSYGMRGRAILPGYAIPYGTGTRLYASRRGRVDLILFFRTPKVEGIEE
ncbi:MAG: hypothetical protein LDL56_02330 [Armatimonadetes bacterium]|nr:hypothetical protein [Armatimonadota bacterium]